MTWIKGRQVNLQDVEQAVLALDNLIDLLGDAGADGVLPVARAAAHGPRRGCDTRLTIERVVFGDVGRWESILGVGVDLEGVVLSIEAVELELLGARLLGALRLAEEVARDRVDVLLILLGVLARGRLGGSGQNVGRLSWGAGEGIHLLRLAEGGGSVANALCSQRARRHARRGRKTLLLRRRGGRGRSHAGRGSLGCVVFVVEGRLG